LRDVELSRRDEVSSVLVTALTGKVVQVLDDITLVEILAVSMEIIHCGFLVIRRNA
jgi:hypothetical protein